MAAEMLAEPANTPVAIPVAGPMVATVGVSELHVAAMVTSWRLPSEKVPVAVSCWLVATPTVTGLGAIAMDSTTAGVTVSVVFPDTDPNVAVITLGPITNALASPVVGFTVALTGVPDDQATLLVKLVIVVIVLLSANVPVAVNCWDKPTGKLSVLGVTVRDIKVALTDNGTLPEIDPMVAEIVAEPSAAPVRSPVVGPIVATAGVSEVQVATVVTFWVLPSEKVPAAISCWVTPTPTVAGSGVIAIDSTTAGVTVNVVLPDTDPDVAVTTLEPIATALASPEAALMVALAGVPDVQATVLVRSAVLVSENVPVAVNCCVRPLGIPAELGVTLM
jgi:hypothetical protein